MQFIAKYKSPLGMMTMASDGTNLTGLWFDGQKYDKATLEKDVAEKLLPIFEDATRWLDAYFAGEKPNCVLPIAPMGSDFRQEVWQVLLNVPYGETITYGEIAKRIVLKRGGAKVSAQAVGGAVGHNPISIIVPCHRVVGTNGSLTGYAGGINRKIALLELEKIDMKQFTVSKKGTAL